MESSIKGLVVILVIVMSFVAVQSVCAETVTGSLTGVITEVSDTAPYKIVVDGQEISGVRYNYLCNQYNICLEPGIEVTLEYYEFECRNDPSLVKLMALNMTVGDVKVTFRDVP